MLRIAICDDLPDQLVLLQALVQEYIESESLSAEIRTFTQPDALLKTCEREAFQIYLLDIVMPMMDGLELGADLRRLDRLAQIVFITEDPQFALQSFSVNPLDYLAKPVEKQKLFAALTLALSRLPANQDQITAIRTKGGLHVVQNADIQLCELKDNCLHYTLRSGDQVHSVTIRTSFAEQIKPLLADERFLQPHSSYLINMLFVERVDAGGFAMRCGTVVPIGRKNFGDVRKTYFKYIFARMGHNR